MNTSYPPADYSHLPSHLSIDRRRLIMSTWHVLEQSPPPSLREILGAYRSKGDGDRDMLIAMLNAKSAEDQRIAAIASLHRTLLDLYTADAKIPSASLPQQYPLSSSHIDSPKGKRHTAELSNGHDSAHRSASSPREPPHQLQPPRKRQRYSRSPAPSSHHDTHSSHPPPRDLPPSPYSSRSDSEECSPRSRASMAIGSLLSSGAGRDIVPEDTQNTSDVSQTRFPLPAIGVSG
ncbi:hypothetical protein JVT61DRAFT_5825 [Boletus reticuloceps]|uniref:Uncharacterized protein n=1 Tax=Boletus reticuloceps TaxID=495285 RepID=A0A8I3AGC0_9AGAM|nr:hypothetical protein JVT61DRAFT_5825 [Boletus reticuloceps]